MLKMEYKNISYQSTTELKFYYHYNTIFKMQYTHQYLFTHYGKAYTKLAVPNFMNVYNVYKPKHRAVVFTNCWLTVYK